MKKINRKTISKIVEYINKTKQNDNSTNGGIAEVLLNNLQTLQHSHL